ncbi:MAG: PIG-L family deacetylase [Caldisericia bacterium]|nr:PIG-L family deacetylase [Caldisericia bacterium]
MNVNDLFPIPDFFDFNNFLIFEPHPDDVDIFMGGVVKRLTDLEKNVILITVTNGDKGTFDISITEKDLKMLRKEERLRANEILGIKNMIFLDYPDYELPEKGVLVKEFLKIIRELKPEVIFSPDPNLPYEVHPDHKIVGDAVSEAFFFSPMPLIMKDYAPHYVNLISYYITPYPNKFVDITQTFEYKLKAIKEHKSQFNDENYMKMEIYLKFKNGEYGKRIGVNFAEAFKVFTPLHVHTNVDSINI